MTTAQSFAGRFVSGLGDVLLRYQSGIRRMQWMMIAAYVALLVVPLALPLPGASDYIWNNLARFVQFVFWGVWWPFVILGTALVGRFWCGLLCPEGALSEFASERGAGRAIPSWMKWSGWPVVAFISTTIYGQLTSIYQCPKPAALLLGGSTLAAMVVGARYGKAKRVWCRFLCPVSGVFGTVSKVAPLHFRVEPDAWKRSSPAEVAGVNCAPLIPIKTMQASSACHMCGRCSGHRGAIRLAWRKPAADIVFGSGRMAARWDTILIIPILLGLVPAALHWTASGAFQAMRTWLVERCVELGFMWPLSLRLPWWLLTNYPSVNDVMNVVDAVSLLAFVALGAFTSSVLFLLPLVAATTILRRTRKVVHHLAQAMIPLATSSLFCGLLALTTSQLRSDGINLPGVDAARAALVVVAGLWSVGLFFRISSVYCRSLTRRIIATAPIAMAVAAFSATWLFIFLGG
ncbi:MULTISPECIES: 4Fe-4S binding protein [unclassified Rhizobium]|uniref:4Fe-4S binding protein n=1 Tax=unclassified Rhizobium TaxID=2613769 RepID=UPI001ADC652C|nr:MULTISPECIES: 4Fe-4S binding protein [unclassified Rhizobium]MBO9126947.1 4Fe-4S binding protein [Rhizobium sp. 16-488-2b]MBO9177395.1 4Fe-4S binding protein [Rhizobium sp. 16-488-2a]